MNCPNCDTLGDRYKSPKEVQGLGIARRHKCPNCRRIFMSLQRTISGWAAEGILRRLEEQDALLNARPIDSSAPQRAMTPSSGTETPES